MKLPRIRGRHAIIFSVIALVLLLAFLVFGKPNKAYGPDGEKAVNVQQGVHVEVYLKSGNCMPQAVDADNLREPKGTCKTELYNQSTKLIIKQAAKDGTKKTVKETTVANGVATLALPEGDYSSYVLYQDKEYCNQTTNNLDCGFSVKKNEAANHRITIDTATY